MGSETSIFWPAPAAGGGTGDGASPYTSTQLTTWIRRMLGNGVHAGYGGELEVTGTSSPLHMAYGAAVVNGIPYDAQAPGPYDVVVPTPVTNTTGHIVVLHADYALQTVRVGIRSSPDGTPTFPTPVVNEGVESEILLAQISITTGGVITVIDARDFLYYHTLVNTAMLDDSAVTGAKLATSVAGLGLNHTGTWLEVAVDEETIEILADTLRVVPGGITPSEIANRQRVFFAPVLGGANHTAATALGVSEVSDGGGALGMLMADAAKVSGQCQFMVPIDFVSGISVAPVIYAAATGDVYAQIQGRYQATNETVGVHTDTSAYTAMAVTSGIVYKLTTIQTGLVNAAFGDFVSCRFERDATHASDTVSGSIYLLGFAVEYTADS